jgi:hypothetical protein
MLHYTILYYTILYYILLAMIFYQYKRKKLIEACIVIFELPISLTFIHHFTQSSKSIYLCDVSRAGVGASDSKKGVENKKGVDATSLCECAPIRTF